MPLSAANLVQESPATALVNLLQVEMMPLCVGKGRDVVVLVDVVLVVVVDDVVLPPATWMQ
jgi:hypothetical protein